MCVYVKISKNIYRCELEQFVTHFNRVYIGSYIMMASHHALFKILLTPTKITIMLMLKSTVYNAIFPRIFNLIRTIVWYYFCHYFAEIITIFYQCFWMAACYYTYSA
jgi:hypothetical protein